MGHKHASFSNADKAILEKGDADVVSMARPFLADPNIVNKAMNNQVDEINTCIGCNQACLDHTVMGITASCLVNPMAGHEQELVIKPTTRPQKIAVIGAGPAGLAFAMTAAEIGHSVALYDSANEIGGQFNMAKVIPGKEEFHETIRYFNTMLKKHKVDVKLGTRVDANLVKAGGFESVVIATGVSPRTPGIPGIDHPKVLSYIDVLKQTKSSARRSRSSAREASASTSRSSSCTTALRPSPRTTCLLAGT